MTVATFLTEYRADKSNAQAQLSHQFTCYLLSVCRPRLYRRCTSWPALGLMHRLAQAAMNERFGVAIHSHNYSERPGDRALADYLAAETFQKEVLPVLTDVISSVLGWDVSFSSLIRAVNECSPGNRSNPHFYGPETVLEFHWLLLACLVGMASTHKRLDKLLELKANERVVLLKDPDDRLTQRIVNAFEVLLTHTRLFIYLISSSSFKTHVEILNKFLPESLIPSRREKAIYERWANERVFCNFNFLVEEKEKEKKKEKEKEKEKGKWWWPWWAKKENENENENENDAFDDGDDAEAEQVSIVLFLCRYGTEPITNQQLLPASTEVDTVVGWVKTFVAQLLAKRALEKYCLTLLTDEQICFNIIATDRSKLCYASWSIMEDVIKTVMASSEAIGLTSDMPPDVIGILKDRILASNSHNKVIRAFKALLESKDPGWFPSGLHCEFILGAFLLYPQLANPTDDKLLLSITEVLWSRPCFPH
jgi:hypothetical protein